MSDRVTLIADAAVHVVATKGMRGLTHRAVDAAAGLPQGSTSAYFRTRKALVEGLVRRLADLDALDVTALAGLTDLDALAEGMARVLDTWMTTARDRTLARYACLLEATHHPELRGILAHGARARVMAREMLERAGVPDAEAQGRAMVAFLDGLLFDRLVGAGALGAPAPGSPESVAELAAAVRAALRGVFGT
ncbi:TetR/AcrR family transcriptional regulator [Saccharothrix variisporea]|uniref:TetR family transcriptional regulator n=1 Tax=Saccharothrix variisporea TaxID=543527 RepID=A0A495XEH8_9PSEU|nr:TetR/AcrR family transcriptional regulator [Saccharothrix variisporea]RKT69948.1 TetR family transcriptional regulator [Saccharothrix variisporea]